MCGDVQGCAVLNSSKLETTHVPIKNYTQQHGGNFTDGIVSERRQTQKRTHGMMPFLGGPKKRGIPGVRSQGGGYPWGVVVAARGPMSALGALKIWFGSGCWLHEYAHFVEIH